MAYNKIMLSIINKKSIWLSVFVVCGLLLTWSPVSAVEPIVAPLTLAEVTGALTWQTNGNQYLWYVSPTSSVRFLVGSFADWPSLVAAVAVDIESTQLSKIVPAGAGDAVVAPNATTIKYRGLFVRSGDQVWYVNPRDNRRYLIDSLDKLNSIAQVIGHRRPAGVLRQLPFHRGQELFDPLFAGVASVRLSPFGFQQGSDDETVLPIASLTKVMTALVLTDLNVNWDQMITISSEEIDYPRTLVGGAITSEVGLRAGDRVRFGDLWVAMLSASSNQAAVTLADHSGVGRAGFIALMNDKARVLGLTKTRFYDPSGLDVRNVSTAREMAVIAREAFSRYQISGSTQVVDYAFTAFGADGVWRSVPVRNRNYSLLAFGPSASKTGYLTEAQRNVVLQKGQDIIVVMHAYSMVQRNELITSMIAGQLAGLSYHQ